MITTDSAISQYKCQKKTAKTRRMENLLRSLNEWLSLWRSKGQAGIYAAYGGEDWQQISRGHVPCQQRSMK